MPKSWLRLLQRQVGATFVIKLKQAVSIVMRGLAENLPKYPYSERKLKSGTMRTAFACLDTVSSTESGIER